MLSIQQLFIYMLSSLLPLPENCASPGFLLAVYDKGLMAAGEE